MATFTKNYTLTINRCVAINADNREEAERIFNELEHSNKSWCYLKNEVFDHMGEYVGNDWRYIVDDIEAEDEVYRDDSFEEDAIDYEWYL